MEGVLVVVVQDPAHGMGARAEELAPRMKLKRKPIDEKYSERIEALDTG